MKEYIELTKEQKLKCIDDIIVEIEDRNSWYICVAFNRLHEEHVMHILFPELYSSLKIIVENPILNKHWKCLKDTNFGTSYRCPVWVYDTAWTSRTKRIPFLKCLRVLIENDLYHQK